jgi:hypothetical protein
MVSEASMDQQKLRGIVFEKTGIKIDTTDPVFALVALNDAVLEEATLHHLAMMHDATKQLSQQIRNLQQTASQYQLGKGSNNANTASADDWESDQPADQPADGDDHGDGDDSNNGNNAAPMHPTPRTAMAPGHTDRRALATNAATALACAILVLLGQWLFSGPAKTPSAASATLNPEQNTLLKNAEKLNKVVQRLDSKTRNQIQAEMDKPSAQ